MWKNVSGKKRYFYSFYVIVIQNVDSLVGTSYYDVQVYTVTFVLAASESYISPTKILLGIH